MPKVNTKGDWHHYVDSVIKQLPSSVMHRAQHKSFKDAFRNSRLATIPKTTSENPNFFARHQQYFPQHQVISSFNSAHRRGDWGLKRPLPPVRDANIIVSEIDTQERQTPYAFATEKPRFIRRMREFGLKLKVPDSDWSFARAADYCFAERQSRRPQSPLAHLHPQWNRKTGAETGPWVLGMGKNQFARYLRSVGRRRHEFNAAQWRLGQADNEWKHLIQVVSAGLDIPLRKAVYQTHPTAGLTYSADGLMATPTTNETLPRGRIIRDRSRSGPTGSPNALVHGIVASVGDSKGQLPPDRTIPKPLLPTSASINRSGRLEITVSHIDDQE